MASKESTNKSLTTKALNPNPKTHCGRCWSTGVTKVFIATKAFAGEIDGYWQDGEICPDCSGTGIYIKEVGK